MSSRRTYVVTIADPGLANTPFEILISIHDDGTVTAAIRAESWHSWGPPEKAEER